MAANLRQPASSPLALAHQSFETASLADSVFAIRRERRQCAGPGGVTLGQLLARAHEAVHAGAATGCPMCSGAIEAHGREAHCGSCGTRLV